MAMTPTATQKMASTVRCPPRASERVAYDQYSPSFMHMYLIQNRCMKLGLYWSYATRSLARGGQRTVLAIFCVAVGVMAIVALQLVGLSVNQALLGNIVEANGGDVRLNA